MTDLETLNLQVKIMQLRTATEEAEKICRHETISYKKEGGVVFRGILTRFTIDEKDYTMTAAGSCGCLSTYRESNVRSVARLLYPIAFSPCP